MAYLPGVKTRVGELVQALKTIYSPPLLTFEEDDVLIVLDAIEAYRNLFTDDQISTLRNMIRNAQEKSIPVLFTRWSRVDKTQNDAVDRKGHWSDYVPTDQTSLLVELQDLATSNVFQVGFINAFTNMYFKEKIEEENPSRAIIAGGWIESCIMATSKACLEYGIYPVVVTNCSVGHRGLSLASLVSFQTIVGDVVHYEKNTADHSHHLSASKDIITDRIKPECSENEHDRDINKESDVSDKTE